MVFEDLDMTFLEMNPLTVANGNQWIPLDMRCELDTYAAFRNQRKWLDIEFPEVELFFSQLKLLNYCNYSLGVLNLRKKSSLYDLWMKSRVRR